MNRNFAEEWLNKLKEYWFNEDIEKAVSLFSKTTHVHTRLQAASQPNETLSGVSESQKVPQSTSLYLSFLYIIAVDSPRSGKPVSLPTPIIS